MKCLLLVFALTFFGCSSPIIENTTHNAVIPLGAEDVGLFIPESWEKVVPPSGGENIVLMARNGSENMAVSFEYSTNTVMGNALCEGAKKGFSPFEQILADETQCFFSGHPAPNTPLRYFWQKVLSTLDSNNFLLLSCSAEQNSAAKSECANILESFKILDKIE